MWIFDPIPVKKCPCKLEKKHFWLMNLTFTQLNPLSECNKRAQVITQLYSTISILVRFDISQDLISHLELCQSPIWHGIADHHVNAMMTSSNGNILRVTGPLWGEFTGRRWIPLTKASDAELWSFSLICALTNGRENNRDTGDLRRHCAHYYVTVMR